MNCKNYLLAAASLLIVACAAPKTEEKHCTTFDWNETNALNGATIEQQGEISILNLGSNDGYYELAGAGTLIQSLNDFTVSTYFNVDSVNTLEGYGHFLFAFSKLAANKADE